jgi:glycosyltransferase involved in cell wall biosynthesis
VTPLFSIVIPVRNRPLLLARALLSLERQTRQDFEVIVVDDGSSDGLTPAVPEISALDIRVLHAGGRGANFARNLGAEAANAPYLAYLDSDDVFLPRKLEAVSSILRGGHADIVANSAYVWRGGGRLQVRPRRGPRQGEDISEYHFVASERIQTATLVVRADVARAVRWDERLRKVQDPDFLIRAVGAGYELEFSEDRLTIIHDALTGRVSTTCHESNIRDWLERSGDALSARARAGFATYVLSFEIGMRSKLAGVAFALRSALGSSVPKRMTAKALMRIILPPTVFRFATQAILLGKGDPSDDWVRQYIVELDSEARERLASLTRTQTGESQ